MCELVNVGQLCELDKCVTSVCEVLWVRDQCARWPNISVRGGPISVCEPKTKCLGPIVDLCESRVTVRVAGECAAGECASWLGVEFLLACVTKISRFRK